MAVQKLVLGHITWRLASEPMPGACPLVAPFVPELRPDPFVSAQGSWGDSPGIRNTIRRRRPPAPLQVLAAAEIVVRPGGSVRGHVRVPAIRTHAPARACLF